MADVKPKGSIVLEVLIVILIIALIATIQYPKTVWKKAENDTKQCRSNMDKILKAELLYLKYHNNYEDTLDNVISFIKGDSVKHIMEYIYSDTALAEQVLKDLTQKDSVADRKVKTFLSDTLVWTILATTGFDSNLAKVVLDRLENTYIGDSVEAARQTDSSDVYILKEISQKFPSIDIVKPLQEDDSLKLVMERIKPEIAVGALVDTLYKNPEWAMKIDSAADATFENFKYCPTFHEPYKITVIDTSVIKILNIECPIDSVEIENTKNDFILYYLGHLRLENHGKIEGGEKSWLKK